MQYPGYKETTSFFVKSEVHSNTPGITYEIAWSSVVSLTPAM